jgi:branched-chain amino acid transport system substrate-binding protein
LPGIFYWDMNDRTRAFTERFLPMTPDNYPSDLHAACYSATTHYLKAVVALGAENAKRSGLDAINWMKANPSEEDCFGRASIRADGRFFDYGYLFQVKKPSQSQATWDLFNVLSSTRRIRRSDRLPEGGCSSIRG